MKKFMEKPEVKVLKLEAMDVIATSNKISDNTATVIVNDFSGANVSQW